MGPARGLAVRSLLCSILRQAAGDSAPHLEFPALWDGVQNPSRSFCLKTMTCEVNFWGDFGFENPP